VERRMAPAPPWRIRVGLNLGRGDGGGGAAGIMDEIICWSAGGEQWLAHVHEHKYSEKG